MSKIIGIDLGTTNSCVSVMEGGEATVIPNAEGHRTTPSVVAFSKTGERMVGQVAKRQAVTNPDRTISSIKREMGSDYKVTIDGKKYTPQEISAMILQKLKADAEAYLGEPVTEAVITVPAYFTDAQRQATKDAGKIAGLDVKRIINEPTAAALAYGLDKETDQKIMVYDLGGGTFDVSVLEIGDGVIEVLATAGNNRLGGDDFDQCITNYLVQEFKKSDGIDLSGDRVAMQRLKEAAEKAKIELSGVTSTNINLPYITADATGPKHLDVTLTRAKFNELTAHLVEKTAGPVRQAMSDAGISASDLTKVLLVGGSSRVPAVQEMVKKLTGKEGFKGINPDECVAIGAAIGLSAGRVSTALGIVLGILAAAAGAVVCALWFRRRVSRPVEQITEVTRTIAGGRYGTELPVQRDDELGRLATAINELSQEISRSEKMQSEFISSISHELRTPLTAITGWSETLMFDTAIQGDSRRGIAIISKEAARLTSLVEELLEFTRIQDGRFNLSMELLDIESELEDTIFTYQELLRQDGMQLIYNPPEEEIPLVPGDPERLKQVFLNILDNAAKYARDGKTIEVSVFSDSEAATIQFRDHGPGIPENELPHVKEKFFKGEKHKARGSGIGLAVCDEIITRSGGTLTIANAPGGGTLVSVRLPFAPESSS